MPMFGSSRKADGVSAREWRRHRKHVQEFNRQKQRESASSADPGSAHLNLFCKKKGKNSGHGQRRVGDELTAGSSSSRGSSTTKIQSQGGFSTSLQSPSNPSQRSTASVPSYTISNDSDAESCGNLRGLERRTNGQDQSGAFPTEFGHDPQEQQRRGSLEPSLSKTASTNDATEAEVSSTRPKGVKGSFQNAILPVDSAESDAEQHSGLDRRRRFMRKPRAQSETISRRRRGERKGSSKRDGSVPRRVVRRDAEEVLPSSPDSRVSSSTMGNSSFASRRINLSVADNRKKNPANHVTRSDFGGQLEDDSALFHGIGISLDDPYEPASSNMRLSLSFDDPYEAGPTRRQNPGKASTKASTTRVSAKSTKNKSSDPNVSSGDHGIQKKRLQQQPQRGLTVPQQQHGLMVPQRLVRTDSSRSIGSTASAPAERSATSARTPDNTRASSRKYSALSSQTTESTPWMNTMYRPTRFSAKGLTRSPMGPVLTGAADFDKSDDGSVSSLESDHRSVYSAASAPLERIRARAVRRGSGSSQTSTGTFNMPNDLAEYRNSQQQREMTVRRRNARSGSYGMTIETVASSGI